MANKLRAELLRLDLPRKKVAAADVSMMLAEVRDQPFSRPGWIFEVKLDGYRLVAGKDGKGVTLISRNGLELNDAFPEVVRALEALEYPELVIDGEVVAMDPQGRPRFQLLQQRGKFPVTYFVFDLLGFEDFDLRPLPQVKRKELLEKVMPAAGTVRYLEHYATDGATLYRHVVEHGLEGIVAKKADAPYKGGRSSCWLKIRSDRSDDFVVVGYTQPKGGRTGFGALHLGQFVGGKLVYAGRAGSGYNAKQLKEIKARLDRIRRDTPPCEGPVPPEGAEGGIPISAVPDYRTATWVDPELVCEVRFKEWTQEGYLRQPVFLRFRDDKRPEECIRQVAPDSPSSTKSKPLQPAKAPARALTGKPPKVPVSNPGKIFWPEAGYTKGDLIEYYRSVSPWLLPYLHDRPVVLTRYPDGIQGKNFFQKDAPSHVPEWLRTVRLWSEQARRDIDYFVCENEEGLIYLANLATIPLHIWASRVSTLEHPDWCSLDLDPKDASFSDVITLALAARELCDRIQLPCYIKTTGSSGLHVMMPLGRRYTHDQAKSMGEVLAHALVKQHRAIATTVREIKKREGKVYVDYGQNGHGKLLVAPFSVRALPEAPVSMPLKWSEVKDGLDVRSFTIKNAVERMKKLQGDPLLPIIEAEPDLERVLGRLQSEL
jgi:bifunctional non-homologous end joining protein LigD